MNLSEPTIEEATKAILALEPKDRRERAYKNAMHRLGLPKENYPMGPFPYNPQIADNWTKAWEPFVQNVIDELRLKDGQS